MPCLPLLSRFPRGALALGTVVLSSSCASLAARLGGVSPYRAPAVVLAYPARGTALPADKAVVLFRFAPREADDPVDPTSFRATVDGVDRTRGFRVTSTEAWGTLADSAANGGGSLTTTITAGPHTLAARVCTARGACGSFSAVIDVRPWDRAIAPRTAAATGPATPSNLTPNSRASNSTMPNNTDTARRPAAASGSRRGPRAGA